MPLPPILTPMPKERKLILFFFLDTCINERVHYQGTGSTYLVRLCWTLWYNQVPWSGVTTNHSTSPFAEEMYEKIKDSLSGYEVVINRWPQYSLVLENVISKSFWQLLAPLSLSVHVQLFYVWQTQTFISSVWWILFLCTWRFFTHI